MFNHFKKDLTTKTLPADAITVYYISVIWSNDYWHIIYNIFGSIIAEREQDSIDEIYQQINLELYIIICKSTYNKSSNLTFETTILNSFELTNDSVR